jgi:hypothetical protein
MVSYVLRTARKEIGHENTKGTKGEMTKVNV